jgi:Flp pilus assembly protein TadD
MASLANLLRQQGKLSDAERIGREAFELATRSRVDALEEASIRGTLGIILLARGRAADAAAILEPAVEVRRERLGSAHERTVALQRELDEARRRLARPSRP